MRPKKGDAFWPKKTFLSSSGTKSFLQSILVQKMLSSKKKGKVESEKEAKVCDRRLLMTAGDRQVKSFQNQLISIFEKNVSKINYDIWFLFYCLRKFN